ncbi:MULTISPECIES: hypothetical protein [unclassified Sphingobium]|uniref:hypothetical protein n=1 Tax=unclassified Sphingobium TaxID=2611147 RepID=UPI0022252C32|nr:MULTISPECIES: hypothetical protein [unclassified Sphingobium]MCW2382076.1 hypothetical protein [Sphingobium sp. B2D3B]MCW2397744.1 hypothetical protein [Sphingobium sp. B2D3C]
MKNAFFAAALLSFAVVTPGHAKEAEKTFTHEGVSYSYTVTELGDSRRVIEGRATPGSTFRLTVAKGRVIGSANGMPVSFRVKDAILLNETPLTKVASR